MAFHFIEESVLSTRFDVVSQSARPSDKHSASPQEENDRRPFINRAAISKAADTMGVPLELSSSNSSSCESLNLNAIKEKHFDESKAKDNTLMNEMKTKLEEMTGKIHVSHLLQTYGSGVYNKLYWCLVPESSFEPWASFLFDAENRMRMTKAFLEEAKRRKKPALELVLKYLSTLPVMVWTVLKGLGDNDLKAMNEEIKDFVKHLEVFKDPAMCIDDLPSNMKDPLDGECEKECSLPVRKFQESSRSSLPDMIKGIVFLTYVDDAIEVANEIKLKLRERDSRNYFFFTVTLSDCSKFLIDGQESRKVDLIYKKCNFVVPILSDGYLKMIYDPEGRTDEEYAQSENLDTRFASYINNIYMGDFLRAGCRNVNVRCFIPGRNTRLARPSSPPYSCCARSLEELISILH